MPVQVSYPGVYVQEEPSGVRTITGVSTSTALFIGMSSRGPLEQAVNLLSYADYERAFGDDTTASEMTDQVRQFFLNGGQQAYVIRIAADTKAATADLLNEAGGAVLRIRAAEVGRIGNSIRVGVDYDTAQPEGTFNLVVAREVATATGEMKLIESEAIRELTMNPAGPRFVVPTVEQESRLIRVEVKDPRATPLEGYAVAGRVGDALHELNQALAAQNQTGSFRISADGRQFASVVVTGPLASLSDLEDAIKGALLAGGGVVTVQSVPLSAAAGADAVLVIRSAAAGGSVRIQPGVSNDVAGVLHLGTANGGLEVDGYAARRPAPSGLFASLGDLALPAPGNPAGPWLKRWFDFMGATAPPATGAKLAITTDEGPETIIITGFTRPTFWEGEGPAGGDKSMRNAREALFRIAQQIADAPNVHWAAAVHGFRLVLSSTFASPAVQESATVGQLATYAIGDSTTGYLGVGANVRRAPLGDFSSPQRFVTKGTAGADGKRPQLAQYNKAFEIAQRDIDLFNLLILPRTLRDEDNNNPSDGDRAAVWGPASALCQRERAFLIMDAPIGWADANTARAGVANLRVGMVGDHAALVWPQIRITDPATGLERAIDPGGSIGGLAARTDGRRGVWKAPAGLEATILGARGVEHRIADPENGLLNPQAINVIRQFATGVVLWGARTVAGFDNSGQDDYRYVPVRRTALFIEESLYRGLQFAVFEPNDEPLWSQIRLAAGAFMNNLFRQGAFQGSKASDAYFVKCDSETTTQNEINLGIVNVIVGFAPLKPAEFVIITIRQLAGQVQT